MQLPEDVPSLQSTQTINTNQTRKNPGFKLDLSKCKQQDQSNDQSDDDEEIPEL